ncbi:MAG: esterase family protein [Bacteroidetes bacterium]|nr:esterase family protein [Bacteroidota bacterium]MCC7379924.1 esterase [Chitinophagaceae bacterium]
MNKKIISLLTIALLLLTSVCCKRKIKQQDDEIYSRHLQRHVKLTVITTPMPDDKNDLNLLILNDGQDIGQWRVKETVDSLYRKKLIKPLVIVAVHAGDRMKEYGVAGYPDFLKRGDKAGFYDDFINNELYPFAKKNATVRKFKSVVIAGCSLGGLSAFDIAWNRADKIDKVGVFSGSFWWRDMDDKAPGYSDAKNRIMFTKLKASRKKPGLKYWFYAGDKEEDSDRDKDGIIDVVDDTKDLIALIQSKNVSLPGDIKFIEDANGKHDYSAWSKQLPDFLIWAFGK